MEYRPYLPEASCASLLLVKLLSLLLVEDSCGVSCPVGMMPLESLYKKNDFVVSTTYSSEKASLALSGSSSSLQLSIASGQNPQYIITRFTTSWTFTFYSLDLQMQNSQAVLASIYIKGKTDTPIIITNFPNNTAVLTTLKLEASDKKPFSNVERIKLLFLGVPKGSDILLQEVRITACGADPNCYYLGDGYTDFYLSVSNPSSTRQKPSNVNHLLRGTGKQVFMYDYNLLVSLKGGSTFNLVSVVFTAISLGSGSIETYDENMVITYKGKFTASGRSDPKIYTHQVPADNVKQLKLTFTPKSGWVTASIQDIFIDACPQITTTTESMTTSDSLTTVESMTTSDSLTTVESMTTSDSTTTLEASTTTESKPKICGPGLSDLYGTYSNLHFDVYLDNNDGAKDAKLALIGSATFLTINSNNTYHVNKSVLGAPYTLKEVRLEIRGANTIISGALNNIGYISEIFTVSAVSHWTSIKLTVEDGGFPNIHEVTLEWKGPGDIDIGNLYVLGCKAP